MGPSLQVQINKSLVAAEGANNLGRERRKEGMNEEEEEEEEEASIYDVRTEGGGGVRKWPQICGQRYRFCGQKGGGVKISHNSLDVIYGSHRTEEPPRRAAALVTFEFYGVGAKGPIIAARKRAKESKFTAPSLTLSQRQNCVVKTSLKSFCGRKRSSMSVVVVRCAR